VADDAVVEAHLRRLDDDALLAFVADLWTARGYETTRGDGVVTVERDGDTSTLVTPGRGPMSADVVVAPDGAAATDARVVDAADLHELLQYAVEPTVRDDLCRRHLGDALADLDLPLRLAARRRLRAVGAWVPLLAPIVVVLVVVLAGGSLIAAVTGGSDAGAPGAGVDATPVEGVDADGDASAVSAGARVNESGAYRPDDAVTDVPGANRSGVTDVDALARGHERALANGSYALWFDESRPRNWTEGAPRVHTDVDMTVEGGRYAVVTSESAGRSASEEVVRRIYYDGSTWYVATAGTNGTSYRVVDDTGEAPSVGVNPFALRETLIRRYLSTPESQYEGYIDQEGDILYRFTGEGTPEGMGLAGVSDYRFFAVVDDSGLVVVGNVEYTLTVNDRRTEVRIRWTYGAFGETAVLRPSWYDAALENGTQSTPTATPS
jgi:hypothetical protein